MSKYCERKMIVSRFDRDIDELEFPSHDFEGGQHGFTAFQKSTPHM